jgi:hypothetical protein
MKHQRAIVVGGVPRSGKTTLCRRISRELSISHVSLDALIHAFEKAFPSLGITHDATDYEQLCDTLQPFLVEHLRALSRFQIPYVLDGYYVRPRDLVGLGIQGKCKAVFLGYPRADAQAMLECQRSFETSADWTRLFSDDVLRAHFQGFIRASVRMREWCREAGVLFVDVGDDWEASLEQCYRELIVLG